MTTKLAPLALAIATVFSTPLLAADVVYSDPEPPVASSYAAPSGWTGAYVGVHAGTGSRHLNPFSGDQGFVGGVQGGYNMEMGGAVVGGELEASYMGDTEVRVPGGELRERHRLAAKAKAGMPMDQTLVYGTAGVAVTNFRDGRTAQGPDGWKPGLLLGAGIEQKINSSISAKVEYNYTMTNDVRSFSGGATSETDVRDHTIKAGLNYNF